VILIHSERSWAKPWQTFKASGLVMASAEDLQKRGLLTKLDMLEDFKCAFLTQVMNRTLPADEWQEALYKLTPIFHMIHKRDMIGEYDTPAAHATRCGHLAQVCLHQPSLVSILVNLVKGQRVLQQCFATSAQSGHVYIPHLIAHLKVKFTE
jgi:hypothetical protein